MVFGKMTELNKNMQITVKYSVFLPDMSISISAEENSIPQ
jgi:hypothetical protein